MKKTSRKRSKKRVKNGSINKKRLILVILFLVALFSLFAARVAYVHVDEMVKDRLRDGAKKLPNAIYSAPLQIKKGTKLTPERFSEILRARGYINTLEKPQHGGEFELLPGKINVYTRRYVDAYGKIHKPVLFSYSFKTAALSGISGSEVFLDPLPLSSLASGSQRTDSYIPLRDIPKIIQQAVINTEDERFYFHSGIDIVGILRASISNILAGKVVQGGSTLTQQLAKNTLFTPKKTIRRKIMEAIAAVSIENNFTKDEILERYLNEVYLGQEGDLALHGVAAASEAFFNKNLSEITLSEAAMLAGIIRAPSYYSPRRHLDRALRRMEVVLNKLSENRVINSEELEEALHNTPKIEQGFHHSPLIPYFQIALMKQLEDKLDTTMNHGIQILTGIDSELQNCASLAINKEIPQLEKNYPALKRKSSPLQAAIVAIEPYSGLIKAWVGGRDYSINQFDHVSQGKRQIGSTVKPFLYLTALDANLNSYKAATADSILPDVPTTFNLPNGQKWTPHNFDKKYHGDVTLRYALEKSLNIPAAYIGGKVGVKALSHTLKLFNLAQDFPEVPAITLGALDTDLLHLTAAYAALANNGIYVTPRLYINVKDKSGNIIDETNLVEKKVADEGAVFILTNILQGVIERGTGSSIRRLGFKAPAAGKTGTSDDARDAWFVGYTPDLVAGVWLGYDDNKKIGITGGSAAAPIWADFMKCSEQYLSRNDFIPPRNIVFVDIDSETHEKADSLTPKERIIRETYIKGTEPRSRESSMWDFLPWN